MTSLCSRGPARALFVLGLTLLLSVIPSLAQVVSPPPPAEYRVVVRYHIRSAGQIHVARFREMVKFLQEQGFKKDPGTENEEEDPTRRASRHHPRRPSATTARRASCASILLLPVALIRPRRATSRSRCSLSWPGDYRSSGSGSSASR